jgi:glycosyltransferase involved in cell wall biosynthesis
MRFAILSNAFPPDGRGGAERTAFMQADALACLGHDVRIWVPEKGLGGRSAQTGSARDVVRGMAVIRFPSAYARLERMGRWSLKRLWFHMVRDALPNRAVVRQILAWKPDVLLTHNLTGCGMGTPRRVQTQGVKWAHTLHDIQLTDPGGQETVAWSRTRAAVAWRGFWSAYRRLAFGAPDVLVSPTHWLMSWHVDAGFKGKRNEIIPNPIEIQPLRSRSMRVPATITFVGRLSEDKGVHVLLAALPHCVPSVVSKVVIVGGGALMPRAEHVQDGRVILRGALSFEDARQAIRDTDVLVAPSQILENQQTVILQAMAEGTPVVATDTGGTRETLEQTGCPVIPLSLSVSDQANALAQVITHVLSEPDAWQRLSHAMYDRAETHHGKEVYFEKLMGVLLISFHGARAELRIGRSRSTK